MDQSVRRRFPMVLASLANGQQVAITINTRSSNGGSTTNIASVSATTPDLNMVNNSASATVKLR
jgi:type IV secretory pathway ATPase VirB11/archaellum biosynthesis ATPase